MFLGLSRHISHFQWQRLSRPRCLLIDPRLIGLLRSQYPIKGSLSRGTFPQPMVFQPDKHCTANLLRPKWINQVDLRQWLNQDKVHSKQLDLIQSNTLLSFSLSFSSMLLSPISFDYLLSFSFHSFPLEVSKMVLAMS
jgi:hypothetical protein